MSGLPREVLKWVQSLDLSYSLKNPRRDFSNGFLLAEILSRYWKGVPMHSIDNGTAVAKKRDNWETLKKILTAKGFPYSKEEVDGIILAKEGCATRFVGQLYEFLTQRKLQILPPIDAPESKVPAFQKATATALLRDNTTPHGIDEVIGDVDLKKKEERAQMMLKTHAEEIQREKVEDPARFKARPPQKMTAIQPPESTGGDSHNATINFKEVKVKTIDPSLAMRHTLGTAAAGDGADSKQSSLLEEGVTDIQLATLTSREVKAVLSEMSVTATFPPDAARDYLAWVCSNLDTLSEEVRAAVWSSLLAITDSLADQIYRKPHELGQLCTATAFLFNDMTGPDAHHVLTLLSVIGDSTTLKDSKVAWAACRDHFLPRCVCYLRTGTSAQRDTVLSVMLHWFKVYDKAEVISFINTLQHVLTDPRGVTDDVAVLLLLALLVRKEGPSIASNPDVVGYMVGKGLEGTAMVYSRGRAAGVLILAELAKNGGGGKHCERVLEIAQTDSWEVQAAVVHYAAEILDIESEEMQNTALDMLALAFNPRSHPLTKRVGLTKLGRHLGVGNPRLGRGYTEVLATLSSIELEREIEGEGEVGMVASKVVPYYEVTAACMEWEAAAVAYFMGERMAKKSPKKDEKSRDTPEQCLRVLDAAVRTQPTAVEGEQAVEAWWSALSLASADLLQALTPEVQESSPPLFGVASSAVSRFYVVLSHLPVPEDEGELVDAARKWFASVDFASVPRI